MTEFRKYRTGWVLRFGRVLLRWTNQGDWQAVTIERLPNEYRLVGGQVVWTK